MCISEGHDAAAFTRMENEARLLPLQTSVGETDQYLFVFGETGKRYVSTPDEPLAWEQ
jgi:hypothetical protein